VSMGKKLKIALLNLPVDNNFGGHLQRYALMEVLRRMGCDVVHLNTRFPHEKKTGFKKAKFVLKRLFKYIRFRLNGSRSVPELRYLRCYLFDEPITEQFYRHYIKHTFRIYCKDELLKCLNYDLFMTGSDQVWRNKFTSHYGLETYFFDYLPLFSTRVAYGVSFGTSENELDSIAVNRLAEYYKRFSMVSVREGDAVRLIEEYGWASPKPIWVLDPTLLLLRKDYLRIIERGKTELSKGSLFCYVLDKTDQVNKVVSDLSKERGLKPFEVTLNSSYSVEQWLRSFQDADFVVTDSYHGLLFALVFNKPFYLCMNAMRGNARFESVLNLLEINGREMDYNWDRINEIIAEERSRSLNFLQGCVSHS